MNIWLLTVGEPIPQDGENVRLMQTGLYAKWLADNGHRVTFVNSTFDHYKREQRFDKTTTLETSPNFGVVCLKAFGYKKTISPSRFYSHVVAARSFRKWIKEENPDAPDVILASYPIEELCRAALDFAEPKGIPVVIYCRDFWPDIFTEVLPSFLRVFGKIIFYPFEYRARNTLARATTLAGMTRSAIRWGRNKSRTPTSEKDIFFPFSYDTSNRVEPTTVSNWEAKSEKLNIVFFGTLSHRVGLELIVRAAGKLENEHKDKITIHLAGTGSEGENLRQLAKEHNAPVEFLGWINGAQISALMRGADFGLLPYTRSDFTLSLPNKFSEYLSASLPVLSCTDGEVKKFINEKNCGVWLEPTENAITVGLANLIDNPVADDMRTNAKEAFDSTFEAEVVFSRVTKELGNLTK